jgi:hypothetical protein
VDGLRPDFLSVLRGVSLRSLRLRCFAECVKDTDFEFLGAFYGPNRVQQSDSEVVAPLDRVVEIPDERVEGIPRVGRGLSDYWLTLKAIQLC